MKAEKAPSHINLTQAALRLSLSIRAIASPNVSLVVFELDREALRAFSRAKYSAFSRARRLLAASALALMRSRVS